MCVVYVYIRIGICWHESDEGDDGGDSAPLMILEYMQHGDLQSFLQTHRFIYRVLYISLYTSIKLKHITGWY